MLFSEFCKIMVIIVTYADFRGGDGSPLVQANCSKSRSSIERYRSLKFDVTTPNVLNLGFHLFLIYSRNELVVNIFLL